MHYYNRGFLRVTIAALCYHHHNNYCKIILGNTVVSLLGLVAVLY